MGLLFDDGAAVWLNGELIAHVNFGNGSHYEAWASSTVNNNAELTHSFDELPWVEGENVLAVMVKNRSDDSSDLSFDMSMTGTTIDDESLEACPEPSKGSDSGGYDDDGSAEEADGCGCASQGKTGAGFLGLVLVVFGLRRRRV